MAARNPKIAKAVELLESGEAKSVNEAARRTGALPNSVATRYRLDHGEAFVRNEGEVELNEDVRTPEVDAIAEKLSRSRNAHDATKLELAATRRRAEVLETRVEDLASTLQLVEAVEEAPRPNWLLKPEKTKDHRGSLLGLFSDYHIAERVEKAEMNGYNHYDLEIAEFRVKRFFEKSILMARRYLSGVKYDGYVLASLGDYLSGDIHDEFRETNEVTTYDAIPYAVTWAEAGIEMLLDEFGKVHVVSVPGNHPRDSKQPRYKMRSQHNADTLIWNLVAHRFKADDRVTFNIPKALSVDFSIYDTNFRAEHGDEAKGGTGIQGALSPLALRTHRVRKQAQAEGVPFDVLLFGHWHQLMSLPAKGFIVNGAGKGYDEYARGKAFDPEPPQQLLAVVTPEHGVSAQYPLFVGDRKQEGW